MCDVTFSSGWCETCECAIPWDKLIHRLGFVVITHIHVRYVRLCSFCGFMFCGWKIASQAVGEEDLVLYNKKFFLLEGSSCVNQNKHGPVHVTEFLVWSFSLERILLCVCCWVWLITGEKFFNEITICLQVLQASGQVKKRGFWKASMRSVRLKYRSLWDNCFLVPTEACEWWRWVCHTHTKI